MFRVGAHFVLFILFVQRDRVVLILLPQWALLQLSWPLTKLWGENLLMHSVLSDLLVITLGENYIQ